MRRPKRPRDQQVQTKRGRGRARVVPEILAMFLTPGEIAGIRRVRLASGEVGYSTPDVMRLAGIERTNRALTYVGAQVRACGADYGPEAMAGAAIVSTLMVGGSEAADRARRLYLTRIVADRPENLGHPDVALAAIQQAQIDLFEEQIAEGSQEVEEARADPTLWPPEVLAHRVGLLEKARAAVEEARGEIRAKFMIDHPNWRPPASDN